MKKIGILFTMLFCLLYCIIAFANEITEDKINEAVNNEDVITMEEFINIPNSSTISMIQVYVHKYGICHVVDENEVKQGYDILMNMPLEKIVDAPTYFEIDKNDGA